MLYNICTAEGVLLAAIAAMAAVVVCQNRRETDYGSPFVTTRMLCGAIMDIGGYISGLLQHHSL